ncbi:MAG: four helix bundle protein [Clostridia bacterium]|nr:four helix bundle protein [Clostridia bacterium]MDE7329314.1 four helix bundle protein [Clostridia bacterium]
MNAIEEQFLELEEEIRQEMKIPDEDSIYGEIDCVARKPFRIRDFDPPKDKEMAVFTCAKKLSEYIFVITEKSPKKLRWSIITRLQNSSVELIENLYRANFELGEKRVDFQRQASVSISLIDFYSETARCLQAISIRQSGIIARQLYEIKKLLGGWIKTNKRVLQS